MRVGIVSDSHHYRSADGRLWNLGVLKRQFECWARLFDEVVICAPLLEGEPPASHAPYEAHNIRLLAIQPAGGHGVRAKWRLVRVLPGWVRALGRLFAQVDAVHVRCPNNISIPALAMLTFRRTRRHAVYTGDWNGYATEPRTFALQRWMLRRFRGPVAVYGPSSGGQHVVTTFSPSYSDEEWSSELRVVEARLAALRTTPSLTSVRLVTVGTLDDNKSQAVVIEVVRLLREQGIDARLSIIGDGPRRQLLLQQVAQLGLENFVHFAGRRSVDEVREAYRHADFVIQSPHAEGFGKVPVEAFFHGVIPVLSDVGQSRWLVGEGSRGRWFPVGDAGQAADRVAALARDCAMMISMIEDGRRFARTMTLESWQSHLARVLEGSWGMQ
ncbi:MAG: glycosyltransferase [Gemmatimonadetes bacterium]|nr:glycosyltransferase [Gemmatimonadota bacterium]